MTKEKKYLKVPAIEGNKQTYWYIDISNSGISELIKLKNELKGLGEDNAFRRLDGMIHESTIYDYMNRNMIYKQNKKNAKVKKRKKYQSNYKKS